MKHDDIEQAVMELCDAVVEFRYVADPKDISVVCLGPFTYLVERDELPCIAQRVKHWAAQQGWIATLRPDGSGNLLSFACVLITGPVALDTHTAWRYSDPNQLGSEELQWIRAVTEMAKLMGVIPPAVKGL